MANQTANKPGITPAIVFQLLFVVVLIPLLPMIISGRWRWAEGWVYVAVWAVGFISSRYFANRRNPGILDERSSSLQREDTQPWDKILAPLMGMGSIFILIVVGFDARFGWSPEMSMPLKLTALVIIIAGYTLSAYALIENRYFSGTVRIQTDRGHQVVSSGPYAWLRHPGYTGSMLLNLLTPLFLDSLWGLVPAVLLALVTIIRTRLEDRTLQEQLPGYREYAQQVHFRLIPGIW